MSGCNEFENDISTDDRSEVFFEPLCKQRIGAVTYIVEAHFDETRENLPEKIRHLLELEIENKIAREKITHLRDTGQ